MHFNHFTHHITVVYTLVHGVLPLFITVFSSQILNMCSILTKGSTCRKNKKNEIVVDPNRAGHDKSIEKKISVLSQILTKLWSI